MGVKPLFCIMQTVGSHVVRGDSGGHRAPLARLHGQDQQILAQRFERRQTRLAVAYARNGIIPAMGEPQQNGPKSDDDALVARAQDGDLAALEQLFNTYRNQVFSLAYRMTGNVSDAEDLCQEIFLQVMRKVSSFQGRSSFSTWLYRVSMNRSRDYLRRKKRSPELLSQEGDPPEPREPGAVNAGGLENVAIASEAQRLVQTALMELPLSLREPLVLHELEGLQYHEVASLLRLPVGTVKSRIFRARIKLAEVLEPHKEQWR